MEKRDFMPEPLSIDLRKRVVSYVNNGRKPLEAAKVFEVSEKTVYNWLNLEKKNKSLEAKSGYQKGHSHKIKDLGEFKKFVEKTKFSTGVELHTLWQEEFGIKISHRSILRKLKKIDYTFKKKRFTTLNQTKKSGIGFWKRLKT